MPRRGLSPLGPDRKAALEQYRRRALVYDWELALFEPLRIDAIAALALRPGEVVIDVGCGTGLSLSGLRQGIGRQGRIVGIEQSPEMIEQARQRVREQQAPHVRLICSPVEAAAFDEQADAALFHFTHDILRTPAAVDKVLRHLKPGARVVATGLKWAAPGLAWPVNLFVFGAAWRSVTSLEGLAHPWSLLQQRLGPLRVESLMWGAVYLASGVVEA